MANILHSLMESRTLKSLEKDAEGVEQEVERVAPVLSTVTFKLHDGTPHTLTFLPKGTVITDGNDVKRVVGDGETIYHEFKTAEEAVAAFLDGKV